jgi:hypothetical protein
VNDLPLSQFFYRRPGAHLRAADKLINLAG